MQINNNYYNQSFGSLKIGKNTMELITKRVKTDAELKELESLVAEQLNNKPDVVIFNHKNSKYLSGYLKGSDTGKRIYEESASGMFASPLTFIRNLCRQATYENQSSKLSKDFSFLK